MLRSAGFAYQRQTRPKFFIRRRARKEGLAQGSQIKSGAAHQEDSLMTCFDLFNLFRGSAGPIGSRVIDVRRNKIDQVVGNSTAF